MAAVAPYDVFEMILDHLDGVSLLSCSCVCKHWNSMCHTYLSTRKTYWETRCHQELTDAELRLYCHSGRSTENWLCVYKAAHIQNTLRSRKLTYKEIKSDPRLNKHRLCLNILGGLLVVTQGPQITAYDIQTGAVVCVQLITELWYDCQIPSPFEDNDYYQLVNHRILSSFVERKSASHIKSDRLPCDVLVMLCGNRGITDVAVTTEQSLLMSKRPDITALPYVDPHTRAAGRLNAHCCKKNNHVMFPTSAHQTVCHMITVGDETRPRLKLVADRVISRSCKMIPESSVENTSCHGDLQLNSTVKVERRGKKITPSHSSNTDDTLTLVSIKSPPPSKGEHSKQSKAKRVFREIPASSMSKMKSKFRFEDKNVARIVHIDDQVVPVIAALQINEGSGKHIGLWTLTLD